MCLAIDTGSPSWLGGTEVGGSRGRVETKTHAAGLCTGLSEAAAEWSL